MGTGFLQGKASESSPPHQSASQTASPQGEAAGRGRSTALIPFVRNDSPSPPSWGAGRYGRWIMGRRPGRKKERTPAGSPQTRKGGSREEEPLPPWCSFLRLSSKESRAPARGRAGNGALRPEAPEKPPPPKGYAVPCRTPARDRAGTHLAGANLRWSKTGPPTDRGPRPHLGTPAVRKKGPGHRPGPFSFHC